MASPHQPVSIVIPCYNQSRFLGEAIESALKQTHPAVGIIVVDDGSADDTAAVVRKYPGVQYLVQRNQGAAVARTAGLRESAGSYLIFLDADDRLLPHAVATGLEYLSAHPDWALVTGHVRRIAEDGSPIGVPPQEHAASNPYVDLLRQNYIWAPGAVIYRRSVLDTVGSFDPSAGGSADFELNLRIARRFPIGCHHQVILEYRQHVANMSADVGYMLQSAVSVRRAQRKHVRKNRITEHAWREGLSTVQADFGGRLMERVKADLRAPGRRRRALRGLLFLLRYYPAGAMRIVTQGVPRMMAKWR